MILAVRQKSALALLLAAALLCVPAQAKEAAPLAEGAAETSARAAIVIESKTGRVLYEQNADERLAQASTTKIMTTLLALEEPQIDDYFTVDPTAIHVEGSSMGLLEGDEVSLRQLCYGMILPSGNDAANVTAVRLGGTVAQFAQMMNERAYQLDLLDTAFVTPSGLDAPGHYTTARDLAALGRYAMEDPVFREICSLYTAKTKFGSPPYERWLKNHNKLLDMYEFCIGVKTGFTDGAGRVLVSAAQKDGVELLCVTMKDADDWRDHENLYERLFSELTLTDISSMLVDIEMPVAGGQNSVLLKASGDMLLPLRAGEYELLVPSYVVKPFAYAPVVPGELAGEIILTLNGEELAAFPLVSQNESLPLHPYKEKNGLWSFLKSLFE